MADGSQLTHPGRREHRALWRFLRIFLASWVVIGGSIAAIVGAQGSASGTSKTTALYTTTDVHGATHTVAPPAITSKTAFMPCNNGGPSRFTTDVVNCNTYPFKDTVWLNGGPTHTTPAFSGTGPYFFAVIANTTQNPTPNDKKSNPGNLSYQTGSGDTWTNREFTLSTHGRIVTYNGTHGFDHTTKRIEVAPFATTPNPGGRYKLAVCHVPSLPTKGTGAPGAAGGTCKYDNFKVTTGKYPTTITTSITPPSPSASYWTDTATVVGNATGGVPTGTVTFYLCKVSSTGGKTGTCTPSSGDKVTGTNPVTLATGPGDTSTATSPSVTESTPGSYCFGAVYGGSSKYAPSSDNTTAKTAAPTECFSVLVPRFIVQKTDTAGATHPVLPGSTLTYTITVTNVGTGAGTTTLSDPLPSNVTYDTGTLHCSPTADCTGLTITNGTLTGTVHLAAGAHATITFEVTVSPTTATTVVNTAHITGSCTATCSSTVSNPVPSFTVQKTDSAGAGSSVLPGSTLTYTITVTNVGTGAGTTTLSDTLPSNVTFDTGTLHCSPTADCAGLTITNGTLTGTVDLAAGAHATITFTATVTSKTPVGNSTKVTNTADISGPCTTAAECTSTVTNPLLPRPSGPSFTVHKTDTAGATQPVVPGTVLGYTITVKNVGGSAGTTTLSDPLPSNVSYDNGTLSCTTTSCTGLTITNGTLTGTVDLAAGAHATITFTVTVSPTTATTVVNTAHITGSCTATCSSTVSNPVPSFTVQKTDSAGAGSSVLPGSTLTYTITVTNVGTGAGTTTLSDTLPSNVTYDTGTLHCTPTADCTVTITGGTLTGTVRLTAGTAATITFEVTVSPTTTKTVKNEADISGPCTTPARCTSTVSNPVPSFIVQKTDSAGPTVPVAPGSTLAYTITVTNVGTGAGTTTLNDVLPSNVSYVPNTLSCTTTSECTGLTITDGTLTGTVSLTPGRTATITFLVTVTPTTTNTVTNTARITGPCTTSTACTSTVRNPVPNITVHKADTPASGTRVTPGATLTYTLTAHNAGTAVGTDTIHDAVPSNTVLVAGSASCQATLPATGACSVTSGTTPLEWSVAVPAGKTVSVSFKVKVKTTDTATVYNHGTYSGPGCPTSDGSVGSPGMVAGLEFSDFIPPTCTTNTVTNPVTQPTPPPSPPPATPKFTVTKSDTPGSGHAVVPGATIAYNVLVDNVGTASGKATVSDPLPTNVTLSGTPACATVASGDTCSVKVTGTTLVITVTLARGDSAKATFDAVVKPTDTTTVVNTATITTGPCTAPHCSSTVTNPVVVLSVVKSSLPPSGSIVPRGTKVTYTLTLTDSGTAATTPITLTDTVPAGTTYVSGSATCGSAPACTATEKTGTVTWAPIIVQPGAANAMSVSFQAVVSATDTTGQVVTNVAVFTNDGTPNCTTSTCTTNKVTLKVTVPSSAATHSVPPTPPPPAPPVPVVPAATTPHTGEPWAGSRWLELSVLVAGLGLLASGESLRRRRRAKMAGRQ